MKEYHNTGVGMGLPYRPLGMVKAMLETIGIEITYSYEDLIFIQHNHFLLQFGKSDELSCSIPMSKQAQKRLRNCFHPSRLLRLLRALPRFFVAAIG